MSICKTYINFQYFFNNILLKKLLHYTLILMYTFRKSSSFNWEIKESLINNSIMTYPLLIFKE